MSNEIEESLEQKLERLEKSNSYLQSKVDEFSFIIDSLIPSPENNNRNLTISSYSFCAGV